jgi:phosphoenolpyruvate-protein kinase (PTS system EI component)
MATSLAHASDVENANRAELRAICGHLQDALASFSATVTDRYAILEDAVRATTTQLGTVQNRADALCNAVLAAIVQCQKSLEGESRLAAARLESVEESRQQRDNAIQQLLTECTKSYAQQILNALHQLETRVQELETTLSKLAASRMIGEPQGAKGNGPPK